MATSDHKRRNQINLFLNQYFNIFLVGLVGLILVAAYFLFIRPKFQETMGVIQAGLEQQQKLYAGQQKKLVNLQAIAAAYKQISPGDLEKFNKILPDEYPTEVLFGELEEIITQSGFIISNISITPAGLVADDASGTVGSLSINLSLSAVNYSGLKSLIRKLENNLRLLDIQNINFSPTEESLTLSLTTYYYEKP